MIFGDHQPNTLEQFDDIASRADHAALMSDGHLGYIMPVGGVAAYKDRVSVSGVGYDIACIAAGTPVSLGTGSTLPVESVPPGGPIDCWDGSIRRADPVLGSAERGRKHVVRLTLANGRQVVSTPDHRIMTTDGWCEAGYTSGQSVAVRPFVGTPWHHSDRSVEEVRILAYVSGDGHLTKDGKRVSIYTTIEADATTLCRELAVLGFMPKIYRRDRGARRKTEIHVCTNSVILHQRLADLGSPVGKKAWPKDPMPWLFSEPAWIRAQFLSSFFSAEMLAPRLSPAGWMPNLAVKQADQNAIEFIGRLLDSLGYETSIGKSASNWVLQVVGGHEAGLLLLEEIGFCHCAEKRVASAYCCASLWAGRNLVANREAAKAEARRLTAAGVGYKEVMSEVSREYGVTQGFVRHAIYDERGKSRRPPGHQADAMSTFGEIVWVPVVSVESDGHASVFDVVTDDPAQSFLANGVVVHNCGNAAIKTDLNRRDFEAEELEVIADEIASELSFGIGRKNTSDDAPAGAPLFESDAWSIIPPKHRGNLKAKARDQLGTIGSGNHYVDVFYDDSEAIWVGVHFGSRGFGHTVASSFLALSQGGRWGERVPEAEALLDVGTALGQNYLALMALAGDYAYVGREWVARKVVGILGGNELDLVHNHHNFAWKETHFGQEYYVVRKGATPAFPGQRGFVGGSMGDDSVILRGNEHPNPTQAMALHSTVHGAGRVMSRTEAAGKTRRRKVWSCGQRDCALEIPFGQVSRGSDGSNPRCKNCGSKMNLRKFRETKTGKVSPKMMRDWLDEKGVILRGGGLDESPHAYRRLPDVLAAQGDTIIVEHVLHPLIVVMAGADEFDPYKD